MCDIERLHNRNKFDDNEREKVEPPRAALIVKVTVDRISRLLKYIYVYKFNDNVYQNFIQNNATIRVEVCRLHSNHLLWRK